MPIGKEFLISSVLIFDESKMGYVLSWKEVQPLSEGYELLSVVFERLFEKWDDSSFGVPILVFGTL